MCFVIPAHYTNLTGHLFANLYRDPSRSNQAINPNRKPPINGPTEIWQLTAVYLLSNYLESQTGR